MRNAMRANVFHGVNDIRVEEVRNTGFQRAYDVKSAENRLLERCFAIRVSPPRAGSPCHSYVFRMAYNLHHH